MYQDDRSYLEQRYSDKPASKPAEITAPGQYHDLAEAMRRGWATIGKKCRLRYCQYENYKVVAVCALGAAGVAGFKTAKLPSVIVNKIVYKNDHCSWSIPRIADWLETL